MQNSKVTVAPSKHIPFSNNVMIATIAYLVFLKLCITLFMQPLGDEAYYWLWGQFPDLSYFDHPGLAGWLMALSSGLFGKSLFALRIGSILTALGTAYFLFLYAKKLAPSDTESNWLFVVLLTLSSPTIFVWSTIVYHDHLLIFLSLASLYNFTCYFSDHAKGDNARHSQLFVAAIFLGLAALTKYSAIFLGLTIVFIVFGHPKLRNLLLKPQIYLAGILTVAMQLPTLVWNLNREFASFGFHFNDRHGSGWLDAFNPDAFFNFVLATIVLFGPFLLIPLFRLFANKADDSFGGFGMWIARLVTVLSTGTFAFISFFAFTLWYWSDLSYVMMLALIPVLLIHRWAAIAHVVTSVVFITLVTINYLIVPLPNLFGGRDTEAATVYSWQHVVERVEKAERTHNADFLATVRFQMASQLAFAMDRYDITAIEDRVSQFDIWEQRDLIAGGKAIILRDEFGTMTESNKRFNEITKLEEFTVERFGYPLLKYEIYLGTNYKPRPTNLVK